MSKFVFGQWVQTKEDKPRLGIVVDPDNYYDYSVEVFIKGKRGSYREFFHKNQLEPMIKMVHSKFVTFYTPWLKDEIAHGLSKNRNNL